jgi:hypothetical protein
VKVKKVSVNFRDIYKKIQNEPNRKLLNEARSRVERKVFVAQERMIDTFENHEVTKEIEAGANNPETASNTSGTLSGYGNLFSYIGFNVGESPTSGLRKILETRFPIVSKGLLARGPGYGDYLFEIRAPSLLALEMEAPMPWANGDSWARGIENGISGIGQYLAIAVAASRSGGGIQVKANFNRSFNTQPYLSKILKSFIDNL